MLPRPSELATGRWLGILPSLGIRSEFLTGKHGPCPMCGGKDRWRFDNKMERGTWICNECGAGDGFKLLQVFHGWSFHEALNEVKRVCHFVEAKPEKASDEARDMANVRKTWKEALRLTKGDPAWLYLHRRTGLDLFPFSLRYHPALPYWENGQCDYWPALVAAVTYPDGQGVTLHRIYLTDSGEKAPVSSPKKLMRGRPLKTASVKLSPVAEWIGIAEGIETALAASRRFQLHVWACISSHGLETWKPSPGVKRVTVFGDNDPKYAGQASAYAIAHKLACDGKEVDVRIPEFAGTDWADAIR